MLMMRKSKLLIIIVLLLLVTGCKSNEPEIINMSGTDEKFNDVAEYNINVKGSGRLQCVRDVNISGLEDDIFMDFISVSSLGDFYEDIFEKYNITHAIMYKNSKMSMIIDETKDPNYKKIYSDKYFVIYERLNAKKDNNTSNENTDNLENLENKEPVEKNAVNQ